MTATVSMLAEQVKNAQLDAHDGAAVLLRGAHLLLDYANAPWQTLLAALCPPQAVVSDLLRAMTEHAGPPDVDDCLAMALQHAYLQVAQQVLRQSSGMLAARYDPDDLPCEESWLARLSVHAEQITTFPIHVGQFDVRNFHNAAFVREYLERFTQLWLKMRLFRTKHAAFEAHNLARRVSYLIYPAVLRLAAIDQTFYAPLIRVFQRLGGWDSAELIPYKAHLLTLPAEPVCQEQCALRDLYVELHTTHVMQAAPSSRYGTTGGWDGESFEEGARGQLMQTVLDQLDDREHVVVVQAKPGQGKTTFCAMLAAKVALQYPEWLPVLVPLRDERFQPELPLEQALRRYIEPHVSFSDDLLRKRRLLIILDGFDELRLIPETGQALRQFFLRLSEFQRQCARDNHTRHKIIITGRPFRIQDLESNVPDNFLRLTIEPFENIHLVAWLANWEKLVGHQAASALRAFLEDGDVFQESDAPTRAPLKHLTRNPLALLLLAELHKHRVLGLPGHGQPASPVEIYDWVVSWVCGEFAQSVELSREQRHLAQQGISPDTLRRILQEIATCIWHEQRTRVSFAHVRNYLSSAAPRSAKKLLQSGLRGIYNRVLSLPFAPTPDEAHTVGFAHKSFGEYLTAEKMVMSLRKISDAFTERIDLQSPALQDSAHRFYSIFGVTLLTEEIWEFVMELLAHQRTAAELGVMTERLYRLYITYSNGRWMNEDIARTQWGVIKRYDMPLDLLQFEAQAGINLCVLLCLLYRKTQGVFDMCGRPADGTFDANRFRKLLAFGELVGTFGLFRRIAHLLSGVNLQQVDLLCANLRRANLQGANLQAALLRDANLRGANLRNACLDQADLRGAGAQNADLAGAACRSANFEDAELRSANLAHANLERANLLCADLRDVEMRQANMKEAVLYGAIFQGASFDGADLTGAIISKHQLARDLDLFSEAQVAQFHIVHD